VSTHVVPEGYELWGEIGVVGSRSAIKALGSVFDVFTRLGPPNRIEVYVKAKPGAPDIREDDELHVILDALGELLDQIDRDETNPWADYDGDPADDPKMSRDGYLAVLAAAQANIEARLAGNQREGLT
jgi:hypothetical protein